METRTGIDALFTPNTIAVIGVSRDEQSVGSMIFANLVGQYYPGKIHPVNPFITTYRGTPCYPSVLSIPEPIDLAVIAVPASVVPSVLTEVGKKSISAAIVISAGFAESGKKGAAGQAELVDIARQYDISLLGPNCLGVIHPHGKMNASFARTVPKPGSIAVLSQSGALGSALLDIITPRSIGISHFVSLGNKATLDELPFLEYFMTDPHTRVIGIYAEELREVNRYIEFGRRTLGTAGAKPIVILKAGKTTEGNTAVHSHTGSLAGQPEAYTALFRQAGMLEATSTQEFVNALVGFSQNPLPETGACAILTNAGGPAILATDALITAGVEVPAIQGKHNPIDLLGDAGAPEFERALAQLETDPSVGSILGIVTPQSMTDVPGTANAFCMHRATSKKPLVVSWMGESVMKEGSKLLSMGAVPFSKYPEQAAGMIGNLHRFARIRSGMQHAATRMTTAPEPSPVPAIDPDNPLAFVQSVGIHIPRYVVLPESSGSQEALTGLSDTLAVKLLSPELVHKSDQGAVRLNVPKPLALQTAGEMMQSVRKSLPKAHIRGVLYMDMVDTKDGIECIVGIKRIPGMGTLLMIGLGGIYVEILRDVSFRFIPITPDDAHMMVRELKSYALLAGVRGKAGVDVTALSNALLSVSDAVWRHPELMELDINPLLVLPRGVIALDARVTLDTAGVPVA